MAVRLDLKKTMKALDLGKLDFYDNLSAEEQKAFSPFLIMKYMSSVQTENPLMQQLHIQGVNDLVNKDFGELSKHKKLFWMLLCLCGSGTVQFHPWIADKKKTTNNKAINFLAEKFPTLKLSELELMAELNSRADLKAYAVELGAEKKDLKKIL